jgi:3-oxoacyl-[acyl-carrier protein] reductase
MRFPDKIVVMTGAAGGIGRAAGAAFAKEGASLVLTDIRADALAETASLLGGESRRVSIFVHDVTRPESWEALVGKVLEDRGRIDVLVNIAGVVEPGAVGELALGKIERQVSVNLLGTIFGCRAVVPVMKRQRSGKIVNIASLGGIVPMPGEAVYSATKFGIRGYSLSLAAELQGTPVGLTVVCPDSVDTSQLAYELLHDDAVMSFVNRPLPPDVVARGIVRAARTTRREVIVPAVSGTACRIAMGFPGLFFLLLPSLKRKGLRNIALRRRDMPEPEQGDRGPSGPQEVRK